jgi:uracil-DNA glycosylase family 4
MNNNNYLRNCYFRHQYNYIDTLIKGARFLQELGFEYIPRFDLNCYFRHQSSLNPKNILLNELREEIGDCKRCKLSLQRTNIVFGEGDPDTPLMFIGEAPGEEEDKQGRPFVGDAGQLLTRLIEKMGFKRESLYITNVVKCRPPMNREPEEDEIKTCIPFLHRQIEVIKPSVIMTLGGVATRSLLFFNQQKKKEGISLWRGKVYYYQKIPVVPTFHPAYLLRNPKDKKLTWQDAQLVLKLLNRLKSGKK